MVRATSAALIATIALHAVAPALAAPAPTPQADNRLEERRIPAGLIGSALKNLAGGVASGAGLAALNELFGGEAEAEAVSKREIEELTARRLALGKSIASLLSGLGGSLLGEAVVDELVQRDLDERALGGLLGTVFKSLAGGAASGAALAGLNELFGGEADEVVQRDLDERALPALLGTVIKSLAGGAATGGALAGLEELLSQEPEAGDISKRGVEDLVARRVAIGKGLADLVSGIAGSLIGGAVVDQLVQRSVLDQLD